jgi:hypothetical protein
VLKAAEGSCAKADWTRAMKHVAPWAEPQALAGGPAPEMLTDVALFEPNQRGRRVFDRFLADKAPSLGAADFTLAQCMAGAFFSIFRLAERHEAAGLWLEDMLRGGDRRLWLVDRSFEARAPEGAVFGMRLFEAEAFHAGFGNIVPVDGDMLDFCVGAAEAGRPMPVRHSLAAKLYGDVLSETLPPGEAEVEVMQALLDLVAPEPEPTRARRGKRKRG